MKPFYLTSAAAIVVTTSIASNLLWVMAFGPRTVGMRTRLQSAFGGLREFIDASVAAWIARSERQAVLFKLEGLSDRDLRDMGVYRDRFGHVLPERGGALGQVSTLLAKHEAGARQ
jgi:uncharacterized protein YjiS (DUF1127 family)